MSTLRLPDSYDDRGFAVLARQENDDARWERHLELHIDDAMDDKDNFAQWLEQDAMTEEQDLEVSNMLLKSHGVIAQKFNQYANDMCRWGKPYTFKHFRSVEDCAKKEIRRLICDAYFSSVRQSYECFCETKLSKEFDND